MFAPGETGTSLSNDSMPYICWATIGRWIRRGVFFFFGALRLHHERLWNAHKQRANHLQMLRSSTAWHHGVRYQRQSFFCHEFERSSLIRIWLHCYQYCFSKIFWIGFAAWKSSAALKVEAHMTGSHLWTSPGPYLDLQGHPFASYCQQWEIAFSLTGPVELAQVLLFPKVHD